MVPFALPGEVEAREAKIRDYFLQEIDKLMTEKHIYHVKNLAMAANVIKYIYAIKIYCLLFYFLNMYSKEILF